MESVHALQASRSGYAAKLVCLLLFVTALAIGAYGAEEQKADVWISVSPLEAYVFVDGQAIGDGSRNLTLPIGRHLLSVHNYGYLPQSRDIDVQLSTNQWLNFNLAPDPTPVSGPMGALQIEGPARAAVLLNGKTPDYFVGHVDEFNNHIGWTQQLLMPPGTHQVTITRYGNELWSGDVEIVANQRLILYLKSGERKVQNWKQPAESMPRFKSGYASTTVALAPVTAEFTAMPAQINCGETSELGWTTKEAVDTTITDPLGTMKLAPSGQQAIRPLGTTTYAGAAVGPGGKVTKDVTVKVNPTVEASLAAQPATAKYLKVGNTVLAQPSTDLHWSVSNAETAAIEPIGSVGQNGSQTVTPEIKQSEPGIVDEAHSYTLTASNPCGGSATRTATLQVNGLIEPAFQSVFFPTAYPGKRRPDLGLVKSEQEKLARIAAFFVQYAEVNPEAKLMLMGNADVRDTDAYNMALSERRVGIVKTFLVAHQVPEDKIETQASGKTNQLDRATVEQLEAANPQQKTGKGLSKRATWLAYNRRVDVIVHPVQLASEQYFPHQAADAAVVGQIAYPSVRAVERAQAPAAPAPEAIEGTGQGSSTK